MTLLQEAVRLCAERGEDFWAEAMAAAHGGGAVILHPDCILIAQKEGPDALFVWLAMGEGYLPKLCALAPEWVQWLRWQRGIRLAERAKVGQFPFHRVKRMVSLSHHHELRTQESPGCPERAAPGDGAGRGQSHD